MRRRLLWIVGVPAILALALVALVVLLGRLSAPFEFLQGHEPLQTPQEQTAMLGRPNLENATYSFRGDFDELYKRARAELLSKGYVQIGDFPELRHHVFKISDRVPAGAPEPRTVYMTGSLEHEEDGPDAGKQMITVQLFEMRRPTPNLFDRIRTWFGL
jgi:hypothetical protein